MRKLGFKIDNEDSFSFVQGEYLDFAVRIFDADTLAPVDLDSAFVAFEMQGSEGRKLRFGMQTSEFQASDVDFAEDTISIPGHPFIDNQEVIFAAEGTPPSPLSNGNYFIQYVDADTVKLRTEVDGTAIDLTNAGVGDMSLTEIGVSLYAAGSAGAFRVIMTAEQSALIPSGNKQSAEAQFFFEGGLRIVPLTRAFNVGSQVV